MVRVMASCAIWQYVWLRRSLRSVISMSSSVSNRAPCSSYMTKMPPDLNRMTSSRSCPSHGISASMVCALKRTGHCPGLAREPPRRGPHNLVKTYDDGVEHRLDDPENVGIAFDHPAHNKVNNDEQDRPDIAAKVEHIRSADDHVSEITDDEVDPKAERRHATVGLCASRASEIQHVLFHGVA